MGDAMLEIGDCAVRTSVDVEPTRNAYGDREVNPGSCGMQKTEYKTEIPSAFPNTRAPAYSYN